MKSWLLALSLILPLAAAAQTPPPAAVAITFDDLPYVSVPAEDDAALATMTARLLQRLQADQVPAVGFVNEAKLYRDGILDAERVDLLRNWIRAGYTGGAISLRSTLTAAVAAGDRYDIAKRRYPLHILIQMVNQNLGIIEKVDTSTVTTVADQTEHSLPTDLLDLKQVYIQGITDDANDNRWQIVEDWRVQKSATGTRQRCNYPPV